MTPEANARLLIDEKLNLIGWGIQDMEQLNLAADAGVAVREFPLYFHYLHSERGNLLVLESGVTQQSIYIGDVKAYHFLSTPRAEQTRIVPKLEELPSDLDVGVAEFKATQSVLLEHIRAEHAAQTFGKKRSSPRLRNNFEPIFDR